VFVIQFVIRGLPICYPHAIWYAFIMFGGISYTHMFPPERSSPASGRGEAWRRSGVAQYSPRSLPGHLPADSPQMLEKGVPSRSLRASRHMCSVCHSLYV